MEDLTALHAQLIAALDELEELTALPNYDEPALSRVRYRLSRASSARRTALQGMCERLMPHVDRETAGKLQALLDSDREIRMESSEHIARWTLREVATDWAGYCRASASVRRIMRERIAREQALLYPLLQRP